ncbi:MAG: DUF4364 family protein [Clostridiales bacterium]|nr:DUF4364 family protein [Clostridiales bacterium]
MNGIGKDIALNKLIVLLILKEINMPLTRGQLTDIVLRNNLINYFDLQQCLHELEESNMINKVNDKKTYEINNLGLKTLDLFISRIDDDIQKTIKNYILTNKEKIKLETQVKSEIVKKSKTEYIVNLKVIEKDIELINLSLNVVSSEQAKLICTNWENRYYQVYDQIMNLLIRR